MKARPILFSGPMVRAILAGTKTQTRRVAKEFDGFNVDAILRRFPQQNGCPYGKAGDYLWVREAFKPCASGQVKEGYGEVRYGYAYRADGVTQWAQQTTVIHDLTGQPDTGPMQFRDVPWKPAIHMPRAASRITLEITGVRVERLWDISETDAVAEGIQLLNGRYTFNGGLHESRTAVESYRALWESINDPGSWDESPWVWVVEFRRVQP